MILSNRQYTAKVKIATELLLQAQQDINDILDFVERNIAPVSTGDFYTKAVNIANKQVLNQDLIEPKVSRVLDKLQEIRHQHLQLEEDFNAQLNERTKIINMFPPNADNPSSGGQLQRMLYITDKMLDYKQHKLTVLKNLYDDSQKTAEDIVSTLRPYSGSSIRPR